MRAMDLLVPLDGSSQSRWSTQVAADLAGHRHRLLLMHVIDQRLLQPIGSSIDDLLNSVAITEEEQEVLSFYSDEGREVLESAADLCAEAGVAHRRLTPIGVPHQVIVERSAQADCVVLAKQGFSTRELGETATRVLATARSPVLSLRAYRSVRKILAVVDDAPVCRRLLGLVGAMASPEDVSVTLMMPEGLPADDVDQTTAHAETLGFASVQQKTESDIIEAGLAEATAEAVDLIALAGSAKLKTGLLRREPAAVRVARRATCMTLSAPLLDSRHGD